MQQCLKCKKPISDERYSIGFNWCRKCDLNISENQPLGENPKNLVKEMKIKVKESEGTVELFN